MPANLTDAIGAYGKALRQATGSGLEARDCSPGGDFASLLRDAAAGTVGKLETAENESLKAAAGSADLNEVIMAVTQADMALQTVVAVRDKVIQAYQDILRMPI